MARETGKIAFYNHNRGFGFIAPDRGGKDVFVHVRTLEQAGIDESTIAEGDRLEYEIIADRDGKLQATRVSLA